MLIGTHKSFIRRTFVLFTLVIATALIAVFTICFHNGFIDAFSLGCRTLPTTQSFNQQVSKDKSSYAVSHAQKPLNRFSRLQTKGANDEDDIISIDDINADDYAGYERNDDNNVGDSFPSFFFTREDRLPSPVLKKQSQHQKMDEIEANDDLKKVDKSGDDFSSPFFAKREDRYQMMNKESPILKQQSQQPQVDDIESNEGLLKKVDNSGSDSISPFFAKREDQFQMINKESPIFKHQPQRPQLDENESNEGFFKQTENSGSDSPSPFFAKREDQFQMINRESSIFKREPQMDENVSNKGLKKVDKSGSDISSPFFAKKEEQFQMTIIESPNFEELSQQEQQRDGNGLDINIKTFETQTTTEKRSSDRLSFTPEESIPTKDQFTSDLEGERTNTNSGPSIPLLKRVKNEDFKELVSSPQALGQGSPEIFDKTVKNVLEGIALVKGLPSKVDETVEKSQQILKDVQEMTRKVNESVNETQQTVEETVEKTQEAVKDVQDFPKKVTQSLEDTKRDISKKNESIRETVSTVKVLFGLERPSLRSRWYRKVPNTPKEKVLDLAGKATISTVKTALWISKGTGSLVWKGSRSIYNNTVGPVVEEVWNKQVESMNSSIETAARFVKDTPSRVNLAKASKTHQYSTSISVRESAKNEPASILKDSASGPGEVSAKNQPTRIERDQAKVLGSASVKRNIQRSQVSVSSSPKGKKQRSSIQRRPAIALSNANDKNRPNFGSTKKLKADRENDRKAQECKSERHSTMHLAKTGLKSLEELNNELDEAQKLAKEISDALDVAELAMKMKPNSELDEPMIVIGKLKSVERVGTRASPPVISVAEEKATLEKKNKRNIDVNEIMARFKTTGFNTAKTQEDLDTELEEAQSLAKEVADALEMAEQALITVSANSNYIKIKSGEATENKTP